MNNLRKQIIAKRQSLTQSALTETSLLAAERLFSLPCFIKSKNIAAYIAINGELDPMPVIQEAVNKGKNIYLPVLDPVKENQLVFCRWLPDQKMKKNQFGIPEPSLSKQNLIAANDLDLVITPLVAFDKKLNRVGMGGGYYDRSFNFLLNKEKNIQPLLIGYAHQFQCMDELAINDWDIKMNKIVTEQNCYQ